MNLSVVAPISTFVFMVIEKKKIVASFPPSSFEKLMREKVPAALSGDAWPTA